MWSIGRAGIGGRFTGVIALAILYALIVAALGGMRFPPTGDELHFWSTSLAFSRAGMPSSEALRSYTDLNTPLPFVLWGALEHWFHQGIRAPRLLNMALSFVLVSIVAWPARDPRRRLIAAIGLLLCPYYLFVSSHMYTDTIAIFFSVSGVAAHLRRRYFLSGVFFVLAVACRQYMVAFPFALAAHAIADGRGDTRPVGAWLAPTLAVCSLAGWYLFFGDFAPPAEIARQEILTAPAGVILPRNSLYLLACVGLYFVVPSSVLYRRTIAVEDLRRPRTLLAATGLLALFVLFPPLGNARVDLATMGLFDATLRHAGLPDAGRLAVFYVFALAAVHGLRRWTLSLGFLACNALVMMKAHLAWDKYALPLIAVLWYLESRGWNGGSGREPAAGPRAPEGAP
jgi:hypothetical protein